MSQEECLKILEKIKKKNCDCCNGEGCEQCFNTGKKLITTVEISRMIGITKFNVGNNLKKLEKNKMAIHFESTYPRQYKWRIVE
jgi:hypothetical protein